MHCYFIAHTVIIGLSCHHVNKTYIITLSAAKMTTGVYRNVEMVDRRRSPNFSQITGYVPKPLATEFKVACTRLGASQSDVIEKLITKWLEELSQEK